MGLELHHCNLVQSMIRGDKGIQIRDLSEIKHREIQGPYSWVVRKERLSCGDKHIHNGSFNLHCREFKGSALHCVLASFVTPLLIDCTFDEDVSHILNIIATEPASVILNFPSPKKEVRCSELTRPGI